ncbi:pyruvate carboxylase subunit B [Neobacillus citreus]|uniref:Pyruvate carboxylase subunit B n=2 Tax=Neobacillus citreus TaxID=2833578 RepID=A0A9J6MW51_9BACI|nr:pyruvate carboxylase subunit B [Neobacillus citreus]MCH6267970.1 pyruvate carboxylase subunit B [Neobacillus citreus]
MRKIKFMDETIRDGQQSLWATRMKAKSMFPIASTMDQAGFFCVIVGSGATFETGVKFLYEDPWEKLRLLRQLMPNTPLGFVIRGRNIVGWKQYPNDVVDVMLESLKKVGIDWICVFDGLNDLRNMAYQLKRAKDLGMNASGTLVFTESPVHTDEYYAEKGRDLLNLGVDAVVLEDASGILTPDRARTLISALRRAVGDATLMFQSHSSTGMAADTFTEAMKHGVDVVSTVSSPLANGDSVPSTIDILQRCHELGLKAEIDEEMIRKMDDFFYWQAYLEKKPIYSPKRFDPIEYAQYAGHQIPGGMMSNLTNQLKELGILHRLPEVLEEAARVRKELGYPVMVTPLSQFVGVQATFNILEGERYKTIPEGVRLYAKGFYGELAAPIDPNVLDRILWDDDYDTVDPTSYFNDSFLEKFKEENGPFSSDEELLLAVFNSRLTMEDFYRNRKPLDVNLTLSPLVELVRELKKRKQIQAVSIEKGSLKLEVNQGK